MTALAINTPPKWLDNLLSHHSIPDVVASHRGVARRIPHSALLRLALIRELQMDVGLSARAAVSMAESLTASQAGTGRAGPHTWIRVELEGLERTVVERLRTALESAPEPARGARTRRPRRQGAETS